MICIHYKPAAGESFLKTIENTITLARQRRTLVLFRFNNTPAVAYPVDSAGDLLVRWEDTRKRRSK